MAPTKKHHKNCWLLAQAMQRGEFPDTEEECSPPMGAATATGGWDSKRFCKQMIFPA